LLPQILLTHFQILYSSDIIDIYCNILENPSKLYGDQTNSLIYAEHLKIDNLIRLA